MNTNPIKLSGVWKAGFALDVHTVSSEYLGEDEFGHKQYNTIRSDVGELLYRLKYRSEKTVAKVLALEAAKFIRSKDWIIDVIAPVPPPGQSGDRSRFLCWLKRLAEASKSLCV